MRDLRDSPLFSEATIFVVVVLAFVGGFVALLITQQEEPQAVDPGSFESRLGAGTAGSFGMAPVAEVPEAPFVPPALPGLREGESLFHGRWTSDWTALAASGDLAERVLAVDALNRIGPGEDAVTRALLGAVEDDSPLVRAEATRALGSSAGAASDAGPRFLDALVAALDDPDDIVRFAAARSLVDLGPDAGAAAVTLAAWLESDSATARVQAADSLRALGPAAAPAIPVLVRTLETGDDLLVRRAVDVLATIGPAAAPHAGLLVESAVLHSLSAVQVQEALVALGPDAVEPLAELRGAEVVEVRRAAVGGLVALLDGAVQAANDAARAAALAADPYPRYDFGPEPEEPEVPEDEAPEDAGPDPWAVAAATVDRVLNELLPFLEDEDDAVRRSAASALPRALDARHAGAVGALMAVLDDPVVEVARAAANGLARLGPGAEPALPALAAAFYRDVAEGGVYMQVMVNVGPPAVDRLLLQLHDVDPEVVAWARDALLAMDVDAEAAAEERWEALGLPVPGRPEEAPLPDVDDESEDTTTGG